MTDGSQRNDATDKAQSHSLLLPPLMAATLILVTSCEAGQIGRILCADADGDGHDVSCAPTPDCDDSDEEAHQHLSGYNDADRDGHGAGDLLTVCGGETLPDHMSSSNGDCDDNDASSFECLICLDNDGDGFGSGCALGDDCDDDDTSIYRPLSGYADEDGDGHGTGSVQSVCAGINLPSGYVTTADDCDDTQHAANQWFTGFVDNDGDGYGTGAALTVCAGPAVPANMSTNNSDCDDNDAAVAECPTCMDADADGYGPGCGAGPDCDDTNGAIYRLLEGYADTDFDGRGAGGLVSVCAGMILPTGYLTTASDCDDSDASIYQMLSGHADADFDGHGAGASLSVCSGVSLATRYATTVDDCDDSNASLHQMLAGFADVDLDGYGTGADLSICSGSSLAVGYATITGDCDDAEGTIHQFLDGYLDSDNDGHGAGALLSVCSGTALPNGYVATTSDCDDSDAAVHQWLLGFIDADGDGYGVGLAANVCSGTVLPSGFSTSDGDCDDGDASVGDGGELGCDPSDVTPNPPNAPLGTLCEGKSNPTGLLDYTPEFAWTFDDADSPADNQSAYRILVASSSSNLSAGIADRWDSGKVVSAASSDIPYGGGATSNNTMYYWKVMTWDSGDSPGAYSVSRTFKTANFMTDTSLFSKINLNYPGLQAVKSAVDSSNYQDAKDALLEYYKNRSSVAPNGRKWFPISANAVDWQIATADDALEHYFTVAGRRYHIGTNLDWYTNPDSDDEWIWQLNRHEWLPRLAITYATTGNETYAQEWTAELVDWIRDCDRSYPRTLDAALRVSNWLTAWQYIVHKYSSASIASDDISTILKSIWQHADYLKNQDKPGNWGQTQQNAVFLLAVMFPEFTASPAWLSGAAGKLEEHTFDDFLADGVHGEMAPNYHSGAIYAALKPIDLAATNSLNVFSSSFKGVAESGLEYLMNIAKPNLHLPALSDTSRGGLWRRSSLSKGAQIFDRADMLYVFSAGEEGLPPSHKSARYPFGGIHIMRSAWNAASTYGDALHLVFDVGPLGDLQSAVAHGNNGHGHDDYLSVDIYAYGRDIIIDPGRYTYGDSLVGGVNWRKYFKVDRAHNTVRVDGINRVTYANSWAWGTPAAYEDKGWESNDGFDYSHGWVSSANYDVDHDRKIFFVRDEYWIITDTLTGTGTHTFDQYWHLPEQALNNVDLDPTTKAVVGNGLVLVPSDPSKVSGTILNDWVETAYNAKTPAPTVRYQKSGVTAPESFETVIYPYPSDAPPPTVTVNRLSVDRGGPALSPYKASGLHISIDNRDDFFLQAHDVAASTSYGKFSFDGRGAYVREEGTGAISNIQIRSGSMLKKDGTILVNTYGKPGRISSRNGVVEIDNPDVTDFRVWCPSASTVKIAGIAVEFDQDGDFVVATT